MSAEQQARAEELAQQYNLPVANIARLIEDGKIR